MQIIFSKWFWNFCLEKKKKVEWVELQSYFKVSKHLFSQKDLYNSTYREWEPFISKVVATTDGEALIEGFYSDIWHVLEKRLNFSTTICTSISEDWHSVIATITEKEYDLSLTGHSLTSARFHSLDTSIAITASTLRLIYHRKSVSTYWRFYTNSFLTDAWIGILTSACTSIMCFVVNLVTYSQVF